MGTTTTSATILYDILRKISGNSDIKFDLKSENKLNLITMITESDETFSKKINAEIIRIERGKIL